MHRPSIGLLCTLKLAPNAMFQSRSSLHWPTLLPKVCSSIAAPQALHDAGNTHPPLFSFYCPPPHYLHGRSSTHYLSPDHGMPVPSNPPPFFSSLNHHHHPPLFYSCPSYPSPFPLHYLYGSNNTHYLTPDHSMPVPSNPPTFFSSPTTISGSPSSPPPPPGTTGLLRWPRPHQLGLPRWLIEEKRR